MPETQGQNDAGGIASPAESGDGARLLEGVLESTPSAIAIYAGAPGAGWRGTLVQVNSAFTQITGYTTDDLQGTGLEVMVGPDTDRIALQRLLAAVDQGEAASAELLLYRKGGTAFWDQVDVAPIQLPDGTSPVGDDALWMARHADVTEVRASARGREQQVAFLGLMGANVPYQAAVLDADGRILAVNDAWRRFWDAVGRDGVSADVGGDYYRASQLQLSADPVQRELLVDGIRRVVVGERPSFAIDYECSSEVLPGWYQLQCTGIGAAGSEQRWAGAEAGAAAVVTHFEITQRKRTEAELSRRALTDLLTGLLNRAGLITRLAATGPAPQSAVIVANLDGFKRVNDSYGHSVGDELLVVVAATIKEGVGDRGFTCRFSGDGFVVYLDEASPEEATAIATSLLAAIARPFMLRGGALELTVTATAGVAHSSTSRGIETLLRDADSAMYRAKELGRPLAVYTADLTERLRQRLDLEGGLRRAVARDEFVLHYQPVLDLRTGATVAQEALVRWQSPDGLLLPGGFLPVAEQTGLIRPIGAWVVRAALREAAAWRDAGHDWVVHVNLAATQLADETIVQTLVEALAENELAGSRVCLELTETELLPTIDGASTVLDLLRATGAGIALDDFGVGYFSLSHLIDLPVTMLKIDRSFVQGLGDRSHVAIVAALTTLSSQLDLSIVAEGIETVEQRDQIVGLGCVLGQGYLLGRPGPMAVPGRLGPVREDAAG